MDIINMSSKQITSNITLDSYNTSGYLKIVNYFNRKMVIKKIDPIRCDEVISKVLFLNRYKNLMPSNFVIPEFLVLLDNKDLYMAIDYINGNNLGDVLKDKNINIRDKKIYLSYIGNTLEEMRHMRENPLLSDFCLGDLHEDNFIVSNKKLYTIDLDDIKIDSISPIVSYLQVGSLFSYLHTDKYIIEDYNPYFVKYKVDYNTDMYCYIMVILNFLYGDNVNNMNINVGTGSNNKTPLAKSVSLRSAVATSSYIDIEYIVNDPENKYQTVYAFIESEGFEKTIALDKAARTYRVTDLEPNTEYTITLGYKEILQDNTVQDYIEDMLSVRTAKVDAVLTITKVKGSKVYFNFKMDPNYSFDAGKIKLYVDGEEQGLGVDINVNKAVTATGWNSSLEYTYGSEITLRLEEATHNGVQINNVIEAKFRNY